MQLALLTYNELISDVAATVRAELADAAGGASELADISRRRRLQLVLLLLVRSRDTVSLFVEQEVQHRDAFEWVPTPHGSIFNNLSWRADGERRGLDRSGGSHRKGLGEARL